MIARVWAHHRDTPELYSAFAAFVSNIIFGEARPMDLGTAMGVFRNGDLIGVALFNGYSSEAGVIEVIAGSVDRRWLSRETLYDIYSYVFDQMGCQACIQRQDPENEALSGFMTRYGFKRYDIPRLRGRDAAEALHILAEEDWRANGYHKENGHG